VKKEIRLYIEGAWYKASHSRLRQAFRTFLRELDERAKHRGIKLTPETFRDRRRTFDAFKLALEDHTDAFIVLLVDSEGPVTADGPWRHLKQNPGDKWDNPGCEDKNCHLMVQTMEAWFVADRAKLEEYFGRGFHAKSLPQSMNVEEIPKDRLEETLKSATRNTKKGPYHKGRDSAAILALIRPSLVQEKAPHCKRLFDTLTAEIESM
jgi:hypothetical protein